MSTKASQITGVSFACSTVCSGSDQRKHQSFASLAFVRVIHRPHKGPVTREMFSFNDAIIQKLILCSNTIFRAQVKHTVTLRERQFSGLCIQESWLKGHQDTALVQLPGQVMVWFIWGKIAGFTNSTPRWVAHPGVSPNAFVTKDYNRFKYAGTIRHRPWLGDLSRKVHEDVIKWKHFPRYWPFVRGNPPVIGGFPSQRPVTRSFDVFFDLRQNNRLSKQSQGWWFETPPSPLWRHCNEQPSWRWPMNEYNYFVMILWISSFFG